MDKKTYQAPALFPVLVEVEKNFCSVKVSLPDAQWKDEEEL